MDTQRILIDLRAERDRINQAIAALEALDSTAAPASRPMQPPQAAPRPRGGKRTMSAAARQKISEAAKRRWAKQKAQAAKPKVTAKQTAPKPTAAKRTISAAGRKRIAEAAKKMWAERKKAAKA
jgi:hypothetical protein